MIVRARFVKLLSSNDTATAGKGKAVAKMIANKENKLRAWMQEQSGVLVAFSGGVDSSYLALIATQELGDRAVCVTGVSPSVSSFQLETAGRIAADQKYHHVLLDTFELEDELYKRNSGNRCYHCKSELYSKISDLASEAYKDYTIVDGTNADDVTDIRPGRIAASEKGVISPLVKFGFTKDDIRRQSRTHDLESWDKPASPCLSSRVAVGVPVTIGRLNRVERGEDILREFGFREYRLRVDSENARIEIAIEEMNEPGFESTLTAATREIRKLGFRTVTLGLDGFRSGSLNDVSAVVNEKQIA